MTTVNPIDSLLQLSAGYYVSRALHAVAELGVADAPDDTPQPTAALAAGTAAHAGALDRVLRLLAQYGVFEYHDGVVVHTPSSRLPRQDHPQSAVARPDVRFAGHLEGGGRAAFGGPHGRTQCEPRVARRYMGISERRPRGETDPATDLSLLWMPPGAIRSRFDAWTGDEPEALQLRARGWAPALEPAYLAHARDDPAMAALGTRTIAAALHEG